MAEAITDPYPDVPIWKRELAARFGEQLVNTGGNDPLELMQDLVSDKRMMSTNVVRFLLATAVESQIGLLRRLEQAGWLRAVSVDEQRATVGDAVYKPWSS